MKNHWLRQHEEKKSPQWHTISITCDMGQMDVYFDGELVQTKVYTTSLNAEEIEVLYNNWIVSTEISAT